MEFHFVLLNVQIWRADLSGAALYTLLDPISFQVGCPGGKIVPTAGFRWHYWPETAPGIGFGPVWPEPYDGNMYAAYGIRTTVWLLPLGLAVIAAIARGFWLYRASLTWPTADGVITRIDIERLRDADLHGGHYFRATFSYDFPGPAGNRMFGSWYKNFSRDEDAREFSERELPVGKRVVVRFNPKNPAFNDLELDSWTYSGDRPTSLSI